MTLDARKDRTALRLKLYANGFEPLANKRKLCLLKGWSTFDITPALINSREWARSMAYADTGIRGGDVVALDWDVDDGALLNLLLDAVVEHGVVKESPFVRIGRAPRELWVYRTADKIGKRTTGHFVPPGSPPDFAGYAVEVLGKGCQFAAYGQRSVDIPYLWPEQSLLDHVFMDLPVISKAQCEAVTAFASQFFLDHGLERKSRAGGTDEGYTHAYDLTDDLSFDVQDVGLLTVPEIAELLAANPNEVLRCTVDAFRPTSGSWAGMISLANGVVCLSDHGTYTAHFPPEADLASNTTAAAERLGALLAERFPEAAPEPKYEALDNDIPDTPFDRSAPLDDNLALALKQYVYISKDNLIYDLLRPGYAMTRDHLRNNWMPVYREEPGKMGGKTVVRLADLWLQHKDRIDVYSVGMRPDRPWPLFREGGEIHLNTYRTADLPSEGGVALPGFDLIAKLLPVEIERVFFIEWLANKVQHPDQRGPGIIMVAHETYGTGRGSLVELIRSMFAENLVQTIDFETLTGKTYQSQYNGWLEESLIVAVDEAQEATPNLSSWKSRTNAYEHLKGIIDPAKHDIQVVRKGRQSGQGKTYASIMVFTNHMDSIVLPHGDRRLVIMENGEVMPPEYFDAFHAWRSIPENVGAFRRELQAIDVTGFNAYAPAPMTRAKADMVDAGSSELDRAFKHALADLGNSVAVKEQVIIRIEDYLVDNNVEVPDDWARMAERMFLRATRRIPDIDRVRIEGKQRVARVIGKPAPSVLLSAPAVVSEVLKHGPLVRPVKATGKVVAFPSR